MNDKIILQVALNVPLRRVYDYEAPAMEETNFYRGKRVKVPFGKKQRIGIVIQENTETDVERKNLKRIDEVLDAYPLFLDNWLDLIVKTAQYYHHPLGEVAFTGVPTPIRDGANADIFTPSLACTPKTAGLDLNRCQSEALSQILQYQDKFQPFLLDGITGSGKTEVYLQLAEKVLQEQKQVLILVPEISLTPQTQQRFAERFGDQVTSYHSRMTPAQRAKAWLRVRHQNANIVIGTRSAVFLPFVKLGLIVCDEEHDPSFKQHEGFRYSARDCAVLRAQKENCPIVLGSATPSFETLYNAQSGKYIHLRLRSRATNSQLPQITMVDVRHKQLQGGLSASVLKAIEDEIANGGQVLLFINRRGYAPTLMCYDCGWMGECQRCDARLTYHHKQGKLICHHCLSQQSVPDKCPSCHATSLNPVGQGTERLEETLMEHFPNLKMARIDSDVTRKKGALEELLAKAQTKEVQLLIGTQILAKGHHFPHLTLVVIVDADGGLFSADFRAVERMAQLMIQVAGRAGRVHQAGQVVIQTLHPQHPSLVQMLKQDYHLLAQTLLQERQRCHLPPFRHFALIRACALQPMLGHSVLKDVQSQLQALAGKEVSVLGPVPSPMLKRQGMYRYQLLIQAQQRKPLHQILSYSTSILENSKPAKRLRWSLDVDPIEMF